MSKQNFKGIAATTHIDRHGERLTKEFLEGVVHQFKEGQQPMWGYWYHMTTLPPVTVTIEQEVEKRDDGEFQLTVRGELFGSDDFEAVSEAGIVIPDMNENDIRDEIRLAAESTSGELQILYDPRNFEPTKADPIIDSINSLVPTKSNHYVRKAELPYAVIFVAVAFATGFIARFGEKTANKVIAKASSLYKKLNKQFAKLLSETKLGTKPDVIFNIPIPDSNIIIEGAVEEADEKVLGMVWPKLPELYILARNIIHKNKSEYFSQLKFLFNPIEKKWEVNYLLTRNKHRVILGPRYLVASHPLHRRWEIERENFKSKNIGIIGMSIGFIPTETKIVSSGQSNTGSS